MVKETSTDYLFHGAEHSECARIQRSDHHDSKMTGTL
jgi:hypothetical protein